ncbi:MAG TPA: FkbM family methyltransferase [Hyphomicrobiaceae bacterium]|nr:FkbM family methyltransferase [Hyphomicrobiaceae bacterium]
MLQQMLSVGERSIHVADVGAGFFGETPPYQPLIDQGLASLSAFEPDEREIETLRAHLGGTATVYPYALGDGREHTLYICPKGLGMSSLLEPDPCTLGFFNLFPEWGRVERTARIATRRLDDLTEMPQIDFLKMDVQGSELSILSNGRRKLAQCVAVQTEISFITLYKNQPTFGDIDRELRSQGLIPHRFMDVKNWSISPTIRAGEPRFPFHQLLEGDIVYIRDIIHPEPMSNEQIAKLALIGHLVYGSPDLAARCIIELQRRKAVEPNTTIRYYELLARA